MACQVQLHLAIYAAQCPCGHAMPDIIRQCVQSNGDEGMQNSIWYDRVSCLKAMMACHVRRLPTVCAALGR